ncbi:hypothetical protein BSKO_13339 [Bryopsis sp. KO-2023]|nr:hypothetical protein BSKO_13339 [Bryopsis sp. KO-2023]
MIIVFSSAPSSFDKQAPTCVSCRKWTPQRPNRPPPYGSRNHERAFCNVSPLHRPLAPVTVCCSDQKIDGEPSPPSENESGKVVIGRIARRTLLVSFKCDKCESRTDRMVNPDAWERGTVFVQCGGCEAWHKIKDNMNLIDEVRYIDEDAA